MAHSSWLSLMTARDGNWPVRPRLVIRRSDLPAWKVGLGSFDGKARRQIRRGDRSGERSV